MEDIWGPDSCINLVESPYITFHSPSLPNLPLLLLLLPQPAENYTSIETIDSLTSF